MVSSKIKGNQWQENLNPSQSQNHLQLTNMLSAKLLGKAKAEYESVGTSLRDLADKHKCSYKTLFSHSDKEAWEKGKNITKIQQSIAQRNMELLVNAGLTEEKKAKQIATGALEANKTYIKGNGEEAYVEVEEDHPTRLKYIQEANKMTDNYPHQEGGSKNVKIEINLIDVPEGAIEAEFEVE